ncbi:MAG: hypothetical protein QG629_864 [Patescibacteria group bacterium]|nr:hypothetical protein [Patescibacteria group bacterium]
MTRYTIHMSASLQTGRVHPLPDYFKKAILSDEKVTELWNAITPLARNEWICWVTSGALAETRVKRITVGLSKMHGGMRRPCCWQGCAHRTDKAPNATQQWLAEKQTKVK